MRRLSLVLTFAVLAVACGGSGEATGELEAAEERWAAAGISDYILVVRNAGHFMEETIGPFEVTVRNFEIAEIRFDDAVIQTTLSGRVDNDGEPFVNELGEFVNAEGASIPVHLFTVEGLFGEIRSNLDADEITVSYNARGNPTRIVISPDRNTDGGVTVTALLSVASDGLACEERIMFHGDPVQGFVGRDTPEEAIGEAAAGIGTPIRASGDGSLWFIYDAQGQLVGKIGVVAAPGGGFMAGEHELCAPPL